MSESISSAAIRPNCTVFQSTFENSAFQCDGAAKFQLLRSSRASFLASSGLSQCGCGDHVGVYHKPDGSSPMAVRPQSPCGFHRESGLLPDGCARPPIDRPTRRGRLPPPPESTISPSASTAGCGARALEVRAKRDLAHCG